MRARHSLVFVVAVTIASTAPGVELVRDGKAVARIVVAADAPRAERFAATELQAHVAALSGARLPIGHDLTGAPQALVLVGRGAAGLAGKAVVEASQFGELRDDGYTTTVLSRNNPPCLVLAGLKPRGTLFAVYNLLEKVFGCGFFIDGDRLPRQRTLVVDRPSLVGNPAFELRPCRVLTRYYGPKRFHATLWNLEDWKQFLRWMAKKRLNCLALEFSGDTRAWGDAFDRAFPETKPLKRETIVPADEPPTAGPTVRMGWGLHPTTVTALWKQVFRYAREDLGLEILYILHYGEYELPMRLAHPKLKWLPADVGCFVGVAGQTPVLSPTEPQARELQSRLWKSILDTFGTDHRYLVNCHTHRAANKPRAPASHPVLAAVDILRSLDAKGQMLISTADNELWGSTQEQKADFLRKLPKGVQVLYAQRSFPGDELYRATAKFAQRPFHYASLWGTASADLLEYCFDCIRTQSYHFGAYPPHPNAVGFFNWADIRGANPLMEDLLAEYAWTGRNTWRSEGASNNPQTRFYLRRRFTPDSWWQVAEAYKQALRAVPRADAAINYRTYSRWADVAVGGTAAARSAVVLALSSIPAGQAEQRDQFRAFALVQLGRMFLHQYIAEQYAETVKLVRASKRAARDSAYNPQAKARALEQLKTLDKNIRLAHTTLTRLIATRKDMCLDEAIIEATATKGANRNLALAIREHQSGAFFEGNCLVDSIEYHQQVKRPQIEAFLHYARSQVTAPSAKPVPAWREFDLRATDDFIRGPKPQPFDKKAEKEDPAAILEQFLKSVD